MPHSLSLYFAARGWILAAFLVILVWARAQSDAPLLWAWLMLVALGIALRLWAGAHLGTHGNASRPVAPAALATTGPYRFSRNPLYLSNMLTGIGLVLFANALSMQGMTALLLALYFHHFILVSWEEAHLRKLFGADFEAYVIAVPAWIGIPLRDKDLPVRKEGPGGEEIRPRAEGDFAVALARQGRNILYTLGAIAVLWFAAQ